MQIFLHKLDGSQSVVQIENQTTVEQLFENESICGNRLVNQGSVLHSDFDLSTLSANANVYVTDGLDGGKKKKKKKVYTTKKKGKHIHKKIKMLPFTLYSVDGTFLLISGKGSVTQARKTCPSCGPGTFMAQHWDRYYCGLCHTTIKMDAETIKKNEEIIKKKKAALEAERKAKEKEAADKAPAGKGKKDAKKKGKK